MDKRQKGRKYERNRKNQRFNGRGLAHDIEAFQKKNRENRGDKDLIKEYVPEPKIPREQIKERKREAHGNREHRRQRESPGGVHGRHPGAPGGLIPRT